MPQQKKNAQQTEPQPGGTRLTVKKFEVSNGGQVVLPHIAAGFCQVIDCEYLGGSDRPFMITVAIFETMTDQDVQDAGGGTERVGEWATHRDAEA